MNERKLKVDVSFDALVGMAARYVPKPPPKAAKKRKAKSAKKRK